MGNQYDTPQFDPARYENPVAVRAPMAERMASLEKQVSELRDEMRQFREFAQLVGKELGFGE